MIESIVDVPPEIFPARRPDRVACWMTGSRPGRTGTQPTADTDPQLRLGHQWVAARPPQCRSPRSLPALGGTDLAVAVASVSTQADGRLPGSEAAVPRWATRRAAFSTLIAGADPPTDLAGSIGWRVSVASRKFAP